MPSNLLDEFERKPHIHELPANPTELLQAAIPQPSSLTRRLLAPALDTHTLLAACRQDEQAYELNNEGAFTGALLRSLRLCAPSATAYSTLIRSVLSNLKLPRGYTQTPQCEGRNQYRLLFSTSPSVAAGKIALMPADKRGTFKIEVGSAAGIVVGTEFEVFSASEGSASAPIAKLVAIYVGSAGTFLEGLQGDPNPPLKLPNDAYVTVTKHNHHSSAVRIAVVPDSTLPEHWMKVFHRLEALPIIWTKPDEPSDLVLVPTEHGVELQRNTHSLEQPGPAHILLKRDLGVDRLSDILSGIVRFHFHLQLQNPDAPLQKQVRMKLQELQRTGFKWEIPEYAPTGDDLFEEGWGNGTVKSVRADPEKLFGLTVTNDSEHDLFPYVLYYNFEDYSIDCLYEPPSRSMEAPLSQMHTENGQDTTQRVPGSLSIGYGTGGSAPFSIELTNPTSEREHGVFVLFVSDRWEDISHLQQPSPFEQNSEGRSARGQNRAGSDELGASPEHSGASETIPGSGESDHVTERDSPTRGVVRRPFQCRKSSVGWDMMSVGIEIYSPSCCSSARGR